MTESNSVIGFYQAVTKSNSVIGFNQAVTESNYVVDFNMMFGTFVVFFLQNACYIAT